MAIDGLCFYEGDRKLVSAIPGNIGIVRAQVIIWDTDPFMARPHTCLSFPCNEQAGREENRETNAEFVAGTVSLRPKFYYQDMFVATLKDTPVPDDTDPVNGVGIDNIKKYLDFVGDLGTQDGSAVDYLPGGNFYNWPYFQHNLWIHKGSLFDSNVVLNPSEYTMDFGSTKYWQTTGKTESEKRDILANCPKWRTTEETDGLNHVLWPYQESKQSPGSKNTVHWRLEKYTPVWQGCDFYVCIKKGDKTLDVGIDPYLQNDDSGNLVEIGDDTLGKKIPNKYLCLFYKKYADFDGLQAPAGASSKTVVNEFKQGISNEAYTYKDPTLADVALINASKIGTNTTTIADETSRVRAKSRRDFWWMYKPYLLIEIGSQSDQHNYYIELVSGRSPRFIHVGWQWSNPDAKEDDNAGQTNEGWQYIYKSRVLSTYDGITSDAILSADHSRIAVRNFMGKLIIQFEGHENNPWIIQRQDILRQKEKTKQQAIPMVVPFSPICLHGGNISCKVGFGFTKYSESATIIFNDIQCDTAKAKDDNLYITFTQMGNVYGGSYPVSNVMRSHFKNDPKVGPSNMTPTVDSDVAIAYEYMKNVPMSQLHVYQNYRRNICLWGRGFKNPGSLPVHLLQPHSAAILKAMPDTQPYYGVAKPFIFGQRDPSLQNYDYKDYSSTFNVALQLNAGSIRIPYKTEVWSNRIFGTWSPAIYKDVLPPIVTQWRLIMTGGEKATTGIKKFDISPLVTNLTDHWSAEEYSSLSHEASLKCYLPIGMPTGLPPSETGGNTNLISLAQSLWKLHNKAFYVTIKYWWDQGIGLKLSVGNLLNGPEPPEEDPVLIQMTGIAFGAEFERSANKMFMNIKVKDYMEVFRKQFIFNSPFYDGVSDSLAVYDLAKLAGFDDDVTPHNTKIDRRPLSYLQKVLNQPAKISYLHNGFRSVSRPYALPAGYADLSNPTMRFSNGEGYDSCLKKITQLAGKTIYFDQFGVLKYENNPAYEAAFAPPGTTASMFAPVFRFVTSPLINIPPSTSDDGGTTLNDGFVFDPSLDAARLVYNVVKYGRSVEDCINTIVLMTASKNIYGVENIESAIGGYIVEGHTFMEQIWEPNTEGFLGFRKAFYQSNGIFGGLEELQKAVLHYAKMKYPPTYITFETYGVPGLKALDIVTLDQELFYITDISHDINPQDNKWWMTIQGEWLKPFRGDIDIFGEPNVDQIPPANL